MSSRFSVCVHQRSAVDDKLKFELKTLENLKIRLLKSNENVENNQKNFVFHSCSFVVRYFR